jgi:DNA-binding IscR family transcriptional regulator
MIHNGGFALPVSQEILANALGITKSYVNRTLATMRDEGLIALEEGRLFVPDLAALERCAAIY